MPCLYRVLKIPCTNHLLPEELESVDKTSLTGQQLLADLRCGPWHWFKKVRRSFQLPTHGQFCWGLLHATDRRIAKFQ